MRAGPHGPGWNYAQEKPELEEQPESAPLGMELALVLDKR